MSSRLIFRQFHLIVALVIFGFLPQLVFSEPAQKFSDPETAPEGVVPAVSDLDSLSLVPSTGLTHFSLKLSDLYGSPRPVTLKGIDDQLVLPLPLPALWRVREVELDLNLTPSRTLIESSQLVVKLNDRAIGQFSLESDGKPKNLKLSLPVTHLENGFNYLTLKAIQHYTDRCEYPEAPQLWTQLNLDESTFKIAAFPARFSPRLSRIDDLLDKATWNRTARVRVFSPQNPGEEILRALGLVAQGIGQRYDFVPVEIKHSPAEGLGLRSTASPNDRIAVVLGTFDSIDPVLDISDLPREEGPVIAIKALSGSPERYAILLLGKNDTEILSAASAFALLKAPWPSSAWVAIDDIEFPQAEELEQRFSLPTASSGAFPLRALGFRTATYRGLNPSGATLKVWNNSWQGRTQIRVHMSYASGMAPQSSLGIIANGVMHSQIPLNNPDGGVYKNYAVTVPAGSLTPGWNTLQLQPFIYPLHAGGDCETWFDDNLAVTVYEDTTVQKFGGSEFVTTDLSLISGQGLIFTSQSLGRNISFSLTDASSDTISAGMTLLAKLSQVYGRPLLKARFGVGEYPPADVHYWVGPWASLPEQIRSEASSTIPASADFRVPVMQSSTVEVYEGWSWITQRLEQLGLVKTPRANTTEVSLKLNGAFKNNGFAISLRNPDHEPVFLFTASDSDTLRKSINGLIDYGLWAQLRGVMGYWSPSGSKLTAVTAEDAPFSAFGLRGGLSIWVSQNPWISLFGLLVLIAILVILTRKVLKQFQKRGRRGNE